MSTDLDNYINDLPPATVRELAAAALKIGYTYGGRFDPVMVTASTAFQHLDEIERHIYEVTGDLGLFTHNEDAESVNEWRRIMGERPIDDDGNEIDDDWSIRITHPNGNVWTEEGLHWETAARNAHEYVEVRDPAEEDGGLAEIITDIQHEISEEGGGEGWKEYHGFTIWMKGGVI